MFSLICSGIDNGEAGDFRRHRAHYDVTVMRLVAYIDNFYFSRTLPFYSIHFNSFGDSIPRQKIYGYLI